MAVSFEKVQTGKAGGFNDAFKTINKNFQSAEDNFLQEVTPEDLPKAGQKLGAVKNGGNVIVNADGTMSAPEPDGGTIIVKVEFTIGDARWSTADSDGVYSLVIPNAGQQYFGIFAEETSGTYRAPIVDVQQTSSNTTIKTATKFAGYILQGTL